MNRQFQIQRDWVKKFSWMLIVSLVIVCGCEYSNRQASKSNRERKASTARDRASQHINQEPTYVLGDPVAESDLTGINGGHRFTFEPPEYTGEWIQAVDSDVVRFYVLNASGSMNVPVNVDSFYVRSSENVIFSLDPDGNDADGMSSSFSLNDRNLALAMNTTVEVVMTVAERSFRTTLQGTGGQVVEQSTVDQ